MGKHGSQIKDDKKYGTLRKKGMSKNKAARIANAQAKSATAEKKVASKGGKASAYEEASKDELLSKARKIGIAGRSKMSKRQLIKALRDH